MSQDNQQFKHYTLISDGYVGDSTTKMHPFGNAIFGMKVWASNASEAVDIYNQIGEQKGFEIARGIDIFDSKPEEPCRDEAYGYRISLITHGKLLETWVPLKDENVPKSGLSVSDWILIIVFTPVVIILLYTLWLSLAN